MAFNIYLNKQRFSLVFLWSALRLLRLFFFLFVFKCRFMFELQTCIILLSKNSFLKVVKKFHFAIVRKSLLLSKRLTPKKRIWGRSGARGGELSPFACPGVGNRPPEKKKLQILGGGHGNRSNWTMHYVQWSYFQESFRLGVLRPGVLSSNTTLKETFIIQYKTAW